MNKHQKIFRLTIERANLFPSVRARMASAATAAAASPSPSGAAPARDASQGDAPILKQQRYKVGANERFSKVVDLLRERLKKDRLFVYVKESFAPSLDERVGTLAAAYGSEGGTKLTLNYSTTPAWG